MRRGMGWVQCGFGDLDGMGCRRQLGGSPIAILRRQQAFKPLPRRAGECLWLRVVPLA